jgi:sortase A
LLAKYRNALLFLIAIVLIILLALGRSSATSVQPEPTVAPTLTPRPTFTPTMAPSTPTAEPSPSPSSTPTDTPVVSPTVTPSATISPTAPPVGTPAPPPVLGRLIIPKLSVDTTILPVPIINGDWDVKRVVLEVGWLAGTSPVGGPGNTGIAGHVSLKCCGDGPFRWLETLVPGDELILQTVERSYRYHVVEMRVVDPTQVSVMAPTADPQLTLVTCNDWDVTKAEFIKRLIVIAR